MTPLPTGTVTFLFTDIEGSTRLVQSMGDRYAEILSEHCRILRAAISETGGSEVGREGDSFFAVFTSATAAASAAIEAQQRLGTQKWPGGAEVRVRMGIHTGEGVLGGDNYIGLDVHRAARIAAAGHGGQVLVSDATRSLVSAPGSGSFRDLGLHRLKDLAHPEHLFQLDAPGLQSEFPPLRSEGGHRSNLPVPLTSFVGREAETAAVGELLDRARLVTLTGPGGTGKTRLALEVVADRLTRFPDGVFFVDLSAVSDPALVASSIATAIGVRESTDRPLLETLKESLGDREILLVLDNFEQVVNASPLVSELLSAAPRLRIVVTSRSVLHLHGEHEFAVPPLSVPDLAHLPAAEAISQYEGVRLFVERAQAARADFAMTKETAPAIAEIVARLDGLPLAIELAASRIRLFGPEAILARLGSRLTFVGSAQRDLPARQQTLRMAIDWSYELLPDPEKGLFRRLAVFVGGCDLEAIDAICRPAELGLEGIDGVEALVDQSLLRRDEAAYGEPRFVMLETIREFAADLLDVHGETGEVRARHANHFTAVAEAAEPELTRSGETSDRVGRDHDNFRAVLGWAIDTDAGELGLRLGFALWRFWQQRGHLREARRWFDRLLALRSAITDAAARAKGLTGAAGIAYWQNDYTAAGAWYAEAEAIIRGLGDRSWLADALYNTASTAMVRGEPTMAREKFEEGAAIARELGDDVAVARFLMADGYMAFMSDDLTRARALLEEALESAERRDDTLALVGGHHTVAQVARLDGRYEDAAEHYRAALRYGRELGDVASLTEPLQGLAAVAIATGDADRCVRLLGANDAIRERLGGGPPPEWLRLGDPLSQAQQALGDEVFGEAWEAGRRMTVDQAIDLAVAETAARTE